MFSERLQKARIESKLTQQVVADSIGVTLRSYQYYEQGKRTPSLDKAIILADILDVSLDYLFGRCDDPKNHRK